MDIKKAKVQNAMLLALADRFNAENEPSLGGKKLADDLGLDSLDRLELCMEIEKDLDIAIGDDLSEDWGNMTVDQVIEQIKHLVNE